MMALGKKQSLFGFWVFFFSVISWRLNFALYFLCQMKLGVFFLDVHEELLPPCVEGGREKKKFYREKGGLQC